VQQKLSVLLLVSLFAVCAAAQSNLAVLGGSVTDPQSHAVAGAAVVLMSKSTGAVRKVQTNDQGIYEVPGLQPGDYQLTISASGFASQRKDLRLEVAQRLAIDLQLGVEEHKETVEITDVPEVLHSNEASIGEVVEPTAIENLPLNGRMLVDLVLTVPGAHVSHGAQTGSMNPLYWRPGQRSAVSVGGSRPNGNYFLLDGTTNTDPTFNTQNLSPSPDAVREFKVQTGSYSAEMGGAGGGQINIVTRSGTNAYHGTVYEFLRNGFMDATSFNSMGNNHLVQNNFGGSFGGPIVKNRTFFFVNYEGFRHAMTHTMIDTVPTLAEINGDFSMAGPNMNPVHIFDPANGRTEFQYNGMMDVIDPARINPAAQQFLLQYIPRPNAGMGTGMMTMACGSAMMGTPMPGAGADCNNYVDARNALMGNDQGTVRVDQLLSNGDSIAARYSLSSEQGFFPGEMPPGGVGSLLPGFGSFNDNFSQQGNISWNRIISPTKVNTAAITFSRLAMHRYEENAYTNDVVTQLGIQGIGFGGKGAYGAPYFNVQGYSPLGDNFSATPMKAWDTAIEGRDTFSMQLGRHSFKFGAAYTKYIWPMWGFFQNRGYYQFTNGYTTQTGTNDGTGSALASFLLGLPAVKQRQAGIPQMQLRQWYASGFAQDSFRVTRSTTVEMGVRYEYMDPLVDISYTNTNLIFPDGLSSAPQVFVGGQNGYPRGLRYANTHNFAPRFGLSQSLPHGLVFHSAFGLFYTPVDMNTWCNQRHNVPYVFPETQQANNFIPPAALYNTQLNFGQPVLGQTTVSFTGMDPHARAQYIEQWSTSVEKSLGSATTVEIGYLGSHGLHLQRAHLINNAPPGPGPIGPRRPYPIISFVPNTALPAGVTYTAPATGCASGQMCFPVSTINLLENTAQSWYDAGYVNVRRRYQHGFTLLANYTWSKNLSDAPDFRSPMFESAIPQDNSNLAAEKGPSCDVRHRFALSAVYDVPGLKNLSWASAATKNWQLSTVYQVQTGFPFTVSVFGDTANTGTALGENPDRANYTGQPIFGPGTRTASQWFNRAAFATPPAFTFGNVGRNSVYGPGLQTLDLALARDFSITERMKFQFRGEFFNALNHTNLGTPDRFVNTPQFGTITEATTAGREIQLSARLSF
jgi:hypothetical protein